MVFVYSVRFKSNLGELQTDTAKRKEAARQLLAHAEIEWLYSKARRSSRSLLGDFNTDATHAFCLRNHVLSAA